MRPAFVTAACCPPEDVMAILRERIEDNPHKIEGSFSNKVGTLRVAGDKQHFWSPCLDLTIIEAEESSGQADGSSQRDNGSLHPADGSSPESKGKGATSTKVWGTFSPRPEIWVGFVFAIGVCAILAILSLLFAVAQLILGHTPWAFFIPLGSLLVAIGIYTSAIIGQGLSIGEMYRIRCYLDDCLREAEQRTRSDRPTSTDSSSQL